MNFLSVLNLSKQITLQDFDNVFYTINNEYKPYCCIDLIEKIKYEIFLSDPVYKVSRTLKGRTYNLNLEPENFLVVRPEEDDVLHGNNNYKINFPNVLSIKNNNVNVASIIKQIQVKEKWIDVNSYNIKEVEQILEVIDLQDFNKLKIAFDRYITKISSFQYIKFNVIDEKLTFENLVKFIIDNFHYNTENLNEILLSLMRHFHFTYTDFKNIEFFDVLKLIKIGNKIVNEENEVNNKNE
tara:strand:- start:50 stop:769 length:720 start_codon:yes stop_codon:yes gene_type:complete